MQNEVDDDWGDDNAGDGQDSDWGDLSVTVAGDAAEDSDPDDDETPPPAPLRLPYAPGQKDKFHVQLPAPHLFLEARCEQLRQSSQQRTADRIAFALQQQNLEDVTREFGRCENFLQLPTSQLRAAMDLVCVSEHKTGMRRLLCSIISMAQRQVDRRSILLSEVKSVIHSAFECQLQKFLDGTILHEILPSIPARLLPRDEAAFLCLRHGRLALFDTFPSVLHSPLGSKRQVVELLRALAKFWNDRTATETTLKLDLLSRLEFQLSAVERQQDEKLPGSMMEAYKLRHPNRSLDACLADLKTVWRMTDRYDRGALWFRENAAVPKAQVAAFRLPFRRGDEEALIHRLITTGFVSPATLHQFFISPDSGVDKNPFLALEFHHSDVFPLYIDIQDIITNAYKRAEAFLCKTFVGIPPPVVRSILLCLTMPMEKEKK